MKRCKICFLLSKGANATKAIRHDYKEKTKQKTCQIPWHRTMLKSDSKCHNDCVGGTSSILVVQWRQNVLWLIFIRMKQKKKLLATKNSKLPILKKILWKFLVWVLGFDVSSKTGNNCIFVFLGWFWALSDALIFSINTLVSTPVYCSTVFTTKFNASDVTNSRTNNWTFRK